MQDAQEGDKSCMARNLWLSFGARADAKPKSAVNVHSSQHRLPNFLAVLLSLGFAFASTLKGFKQQFNSMQQIVHHHIFPSWTNLELCSDLCLVRL